MKNFIKMIRGSALIGAALMAIAACTVEAPPADGGDGDTGGDGDGDVAGTGGAGACTAGALSCNGTCTNPQSDPNNCGACGTACGALLCSAGACSATCATGLLQCGASCANVQSDFQNCGACGTVCASGVCTAGVCQAVQTGTGGAGPGTGGAGPGTGGAGPGTGGAGPGTGGAGPGTGGGSNGGDPPGFWRYGDLHGCAWTGIDATGSGTTIAPQDFTARGPTEAYCASGSVGANADYESVALLGFNVGEDPATADCTYDPNAAQSEGPPGVALTGDGIAANIVKQGADTAFTFRVQIQGPNGATDANDRWCATITATQGKIFVPWLDFNTECWPGGAGTAYANQPISAVVFLVPGEPAAVPYDFCVNGFTTGSSAEDAPDGPAEIGDQTGTVGDSTADGDFRRAKVLVGGEEYIIQNNNWGNPGGTDLILNYFNNSFTVASGSGSPAGGGAPASFPSIYIGANGNTANGVYATSATDNLPRQVSQISSIPTSFTWSGTTGQFNTTYDVWFANSPPSGQYNDGIDGFVMVWAHDPSNYQPIGSPENGTVNIAGVDWKVWVGVRGPAPNNPNGNTNAPVVSFVAPSDVSTLSFDLKDFIDAASTRGITPSMYLTDVFFGFEIWEGGAGGNLKVDSFTIDVQ